MKKTVLLFYLLAFSITAFSQKDTEPERIEKYIKKEKGKFGLWDKTEKKWLIPPEYNKISGISFSEKSYEIENRIFFKLWKENTYDLLRVTENTKTFKDEFEIWVKDISDIHRPNIKAIKENEYSARDYYNFIFYKQGGKWGWFVNKLEILRGGYFSSEENFVFAPKFDNPPVVTDFCQSSFYNVAYNNYILQVDSSNQIGLYSLGGYPLVIPGNYKSFKLPESIDYKNDIFITTENANGLLGYSYNGKTVAPAYKSVSGSKTKKYYYVKPSEFFDCILPDGTHEWRDGVSLISNEEVKRMDADEKKIASAAVEESSKKQRESQYAIEANVNKEEINPFEVVKYVRSGSAKDLLVYSQKFGANYTSTKKDGSVEYRVTGALEAGPETIIDSKKDGITVSFKFKDYSQKNIYMGKLKEKDFTVIELSKFSTKVRKDGVDIWFTLGSIGQQTWIISKASQ